MAVGKEDHEIVLRWFHAVYRERARGEQAEQATRNSDPHAICQKFD
jgi:hypothetical protein